MPLLHRPSPNFDARAAGTRIRYVILHYTGMPDFDAALTRMTDPDAKVSAHYAVRQDGQLFQLVAEEDRAWHAGVSFWRGEKDLNSLSIGVEIDNPGHQHGYRPFPDRQIKAVTDLLRDLQRRYALPAGAFLAHSDVAPLRKEDPGELFPWQALAAEGLGLWPDITFPDRSPADLPAIAAMLSGLGYQTAFGPEGTYDLALRRVILAFQRHWHPTSLTGTPDPETVARLRALARVCAQYAA